MKNKEKESKEEVRKPLVSFVVIGYNTEKWVPQVLNSVLEQDYPNKEIIFVDDGSKDNTVKEAKKFESKGVQVHENLANCGAPTTRNRGADAATGEYLIFVDTDSKFKAGTITKQIEFLEENEDYGFYYGGYDICDDKELKHSIVEYRSEEFDRYFLEQGNYISGTTLMRMECFKYAVDRQGGWDPKIKSLQDWDLFLIITEKYKGYYSPELHFATFLSGETDGKKGISYDSSINWLKRIDYIKKKHGLDDREICVASLGAPNHGRKIAKVLGADFKMMPSQKPNRYKMIYLLGFYPQTADHHSQIFGGNKGVRLVHWIGTDMSQFNGLPYNIALKFKKLLDEEFPHHLTEIEFAQDEMKNLGVKTNILPLPVENDIKVTPLPKKFKVAIYMPETNRDNHNFKVIMEVVRTMPDVDFKMFGTRGEVGVPVDVKNFEYMGYLDNKGIRNLIDDTSMILRLTSHDGLPITPCEWIMGGRNVLFTKKLPYSEFTTGESLKGIVDKIRSMKTLPLNEIGAKYYQKWLDKDKFRKKIKSYLKKK